jgi:hypothetical protein
MRSLLLPLGLLACDSTPGTGLGPPDTGSTPDAAEIGKDAEPPIDTGVVPEDTGVPYYTWWQDVEPIVRDRCQICHASPPQFGAPRAFVDYADTQVLIQGTPAHEVMVFRIHADQNRMPPSSQPQLTDEQKRIIRIWSEIGAPEGTRPVMTDAGTLDMGTPDPDAGSGDPDGGVGRPISRVFELRATEQGTSNPFQIPVGNTQYLCWSFDVPPGMTGQEYAFRFEPLIDNTAHTHHTLLFHDANGGNGAGPFDCEGFPLDWNMIAGWAPGRMADEIPAGAGVPISAGEQIVLQVHYDGVTTAGETDNSGMRMLLTDEQGLTPAGIVWAGVIWSTALNGSNVSREHTCRIQSPVTMFTVFPHMHKAGTRITLEVQRSGQSTWTTLVDISGWSFEDQPNVPIDPAEQSFMPGDRLRTKCWWDTNGQSINFGEASDDEMCFNFVYHYPKLGFEYACVGYAP